MDKVIYIPEEVKKVNTGLSDAELNDYLDNVWDLLLKMKPGDVYEIASTARKHPDLFIECAKDYMRNHEWQDGLSFTRGFKAIQKYDVVFGKGVKTPSACGISPQGGRGSAGAL